MAVSAAMLVQTDSDDMFLLLTGTPRDSAAQVSGLWAAAPTLPLGVFRASVVKQRVAVL